eukprot:4083168-Prymnesium_polylepis.3
MVGLHACFASHELAAASLAAFISGMAMGHGLRGPRLIGVSLDMALSLTGRRITLWTAYVLGRFGVNIALTAVET